MALFGLVFVAPVFEAMYFDFGADLPPLTRWCFQVSSGIRHFWEFSVPLLFGLATIVAYASNRAGRKAIRRALYLSGAGTLGLLVFALFLPIFYLGTISLAQ